MWTDERVTTLKKLWIEGLSASQVAQQLGGVTRNAVIGKVHRLGLSGRAPGGTMPRRPRPARAARPVVLRPSPPRPISPGPAAPRAMPVCEAPDEPGLISCLAALSAQVCKWPIGDPLQPGFTFCGAQSLDAGPYCARHHARAHQPLAAASLADDPQVRRLLAA